MALRYCRGVREGDSARVFDGGLHSNLIDEGFLLLSKNRHPVMSLLPFPFIVSIQSPILRVFPSLSITTICVS